MKKDFFIQRRKDLIENIKKFYPNQKGSIFFWGNFENAQTSFFQNPTFYYFTGIDEPATAICIDLDGKTTLYIPQTQGLRAQWFEHSLEPSDSLAQELGVDEIVYLGESCKSYSLSPLFNSAEYKDLILSIKALIKNEKIFTCWPTAGSFYVEQVGVLERLGNMIQGFHEKSIDISNLVASMRRVKSKEEIEQIFNAIQLTNIAQLGVASMMNQERSELEIKAGIEYIFTAGGGTSAFPTIVASGVKSSIIHYEPSEKMLKDGELVIVDCGARLDHYCADITRTYPVSGAFNNEQKKWYALVLECQDYIASLLKPGMYLSNKEKPAQSLNHLAFKFFEEKRVSQYFSHGIGHFLGLDVHDVGNVQEPLQEGDVITIEPGLYVPEKNMGIRIEDDYWIIKDGAHCLSEDIPKAIDDIEKLRAKEIE